MCLSVTHVVVRVRLQKDRWTSFRSDTLAERVQEAIGLEPRGNGCLALEEKAGLREYVLRLTKILPLLTFVHLDTRKESVSHWRIQRRDKKRAVVTEVVREIGRTILEKRGVGSLFTAPPSYRWSSNTGILHAYVSKFEEVSVSKSY
ncbi:hypothetical protein CERSUDRAFT_115661 [Gelatoporia subvermispora B]|uniref:Uncharacterized protein n=1 Tax=Ceriporiopsis subvermispora (strain B) TaxID=914234 RepID=M2PK35_CERS8|nr:hypothetical protein CERSUDRAFT_115661 [Gelatoporia subvermispora B]